MSTTTLSNRRTSKAVWLSGLLVVLALVAAACGSSSDDSSTGTSSAGGDVTPGGAEGLDIDYASLSGTLDGSGATFPKGFYEVAIEEFESVAPGVTVNYGGGGSGKGKQDLADQVTVWAGTDSLVKDEDAVRFKGGEFLYFPTVAAPVTVSYNLDGVDELHLSPSVLGKIFSGTIASWDDPAIAADNSGVSLPSEPITLAVRADGSGTTSNFTKYLVAAAGDDWTLGSGDTVPWAGNVIAGQGSSGVSQTISSTPGAIGYVDLSDAVASGLTFASIQNKDGEFVQPTLEAASAAVEGAELESDLTLNPLNPGGADAYPITAVTYILVYADQTDATIGAAVKGWINYVLTEAQDFAAEVDFAPLPASVQDAAIAQLDKITIPRT